MNVEPIEQKLAYAVVVVGESLGLEPTVVKKTLQFLFGTSFFIGLQISQLHRSLQVQLSSSL